MYVKIVGHKRTDLIPLLIVREDNELIGDAFRNIVEVSVSPGLTDFIQLIMLEIQLDWDCLFQKH